MQGEQMQDQLMNGLLPGTSGTAADVLTISEAATLLRCSKAHVQNLLAGKVKGSRPLPYIR
jgi:hypothetical protein